MFVWLCVRVYVCVNVYVCVRVRACLHMRERVCCVYACVLARTCVSVYNKPNVQVTICATTKICPQRTTVSLSRQSVVLITRMRVVAGADLGPIVNTQLGSKASVGCRRPSSALAAFRWVTQLRQTSPEISGEIRRSHRGRIDA